MTATQPTKVFGFRFSGDPRWFVGGLLGLACFLFWYSSHAQDGATLATSSPLTVQAGLVPRTHNPLRSGKANNPIRGGLRVRPIDGSQGDIDPTLHLLMLARLQTPESYAEERNVFEMRKPPVAALPPIKAPILIPQPLPASQTLKPSLAQANIPLKYYGFVRSPDKARADRGLFMDGEAVVVAGEGEVVKGRYLVEKLSQTSARLEDTQVKLAQVLPVAAELAP